MENTYKIIIAIAVIIIVIASIFAYMSLSSPTEQVSLSGSGATFPVPLLDALITKYESDVKSNVLIDYEGIGSGGGIAKQETSQGQMHR